MNETVLINAVRIELGLNINISLHAVLRYIERTYHKDIRFECERRWKFLEHGLSADDYQLMKFIKKFYPNDYERAMDDIYFFTNDKLKTFDYDGLRFVIRDDTVVTIHTI